jgi:hypothetical protein
MDYFTAAAAFQAANEASRIREIAEDYAHENQPLSDGEWDQINAERDRVGSAAARVGDDRWRILGSMCIAIRSGGLFHSEPDADFYNLHFQGRLQIELDSQRTKIDWANKTIRVFNGHDELPTIRLANPEEIEGITKELKPGDRAAGVVRYRCHRSGCSREAAKGIFLAYYPEPRSGYGCPIEGNTAEYGKPFKYHFYRYLQKNIPSIFGHVDSQKPE